VWFGFVDFSQTDAEQVSFDLACYHGGPSDEEWYTNSVSALRSVPVAPDASVHPIAHDAPVPYSQWFPTDGAGEWNPSQCVSGSCNLVWLYVNNGVVTELVQLFAS
jgi:hypothetical protein